MKKIFLIFIFILSSCSSSNIQTNLNDNINFSDQMDFEDFKLKLKKYAEQSPYPNIEN